MTVRGLEAGQRAALLISECQKAMTMAEYRDARDDLAREVAERAIIPAISNLAAEFRARGLPVFHSHLVPREDWSGFRINCALAAALKRTDVLHAGHPGSEPHDGLRPVPGDYVVRRSTGMTSFYGTEIDPLLRSLGIDTIVVTGVSVNVAVYGTTLEAVNRGYSVVVPTDCVAGVGRSYHCLLEDILPVLAAMSDAPSIITALNASPQD